MKIMRFIQEWKDAFLTWDEDSTGVSRFIVASKKLWLPEIAPYNRYTILIILNKLKDNNESERNYIMQ